MIDAQIRGKVLEFMHSHSSEQIDSIRLSKELRISKEDINNNISYLMNNKLVAIEKTLFGGDYLIKSLPTGIELIETFKKVNHEVESSNIGTSEKNEIKNLTFALNFEILKSEKERDKKKIEEIISKLGKYSRDITSVIVLIGLIKVMLGI